MAVTRTYSGDEPVRVNKWMAQSGLCSRREAEALIEQGLIEIDGTAVQSPGHKIEPGQTLTLLDKGADKLAAKLSVVLHKPEGYVSGTPEGEQVPAVRLLTRQNLSGRAPVMPGRRHKLAPLGRLDQDSRGLLIMSEDGVLAKAIIGPESRLEKEYRVRVVGKLPRENLALLRHGLKLDDRALKPAIVEPVGPGMLKFVLNEGRNRQIRRMCDLVDLKVIDLIRVRIGPLSLGDLPEGKWRPLGAKEQSKLIEQSSVG
ncbi:MAG: pseudouridine synthase [Pseudomonadota bacterium]